MNTIVRLVVQQHRLSVRLVIGSALLLIATALGLSGMITALDLPRCIAMPVPDAGCIAAAETMPTYYLLVKGLQAVALLLTLFAALFLGVPLVASEVETTTGIMAWTLCPDRRRWLWPRMLFVVTLVTLLAGGLGLALNLLSAVTYPAESVWASFLDYQTRGPIVAAYAFVAIAAGVLAGAVTGRSLSGLLVGMLLTAALLIGLNLLGSSLNLAISPTTYEQGIGIETDQRYRNAAGDLFTAEEATSQVAGDDPAFFSTFNVVSIGVPPSAEMAVVARDVLLHLGVGLLLLVSSTKVVERRRPY